MKWHKRPAWRYGAKPDQNNPLFIINRREAEAKRLYRASKHKRFTHARR